MGLEMIKLKDILNEAKYKGYDYKRQNRKRGLPLIVPALRKTFANMKDLKKYIDKHGKMESVNERIPKLPRINMGFGEAQDYSKMMIKKSQDVFKSTRAGDMGKAKKAVKDMEEIVTQIKRVLGI